MKIITNALLAILSISSVVSCGRQFSDKTSPKAPEVIQPQPVVIPVHHASVFSSFKSEDGQTFKVSPAEFNVPVLWEGKVILSYWLADSELWDCAASVVVSGSNSSGNIEFSQVHCSKGNASIHWANKFQSNYVISDDNVLSFVTPTPFFFEHKEYSEVK